MFKFQIVLFEHGFCKDSISEFSTSMIKKFAATALLGNSSKSFFFRHLFTAHVRLVFHYTINPHNIDEPKSFLLDELML